jgi:hypothetical protein
VFPSRDGISARSSRNEARSVFMFFSSEKSTTDTISGRIQRIILFSVPCEIGSIISSSLLVGAEDAEDADDAEGGRGGRFSKDDLLECPLLAVAMMVKLGTGDKSVI